MLRRKMTDELDILQPNDRDECDACGRLKTLHSTMWTCPECGRAVCQDCMADFNNGWRCRDCAEARVSVAQECELCGAMSPSLDDGLCASCAVTAALYDVAAAQMTSSGQDGSPGWRRLARDLAQA